MKGYKVFDPNWKCRGYQYKVGETFEEDAKPSCCNRGFHFCTELKDCFNYYSFDPNNKVAEIEALGEVDAEENGAKRCTNKIKIVREITWQEVLKMVNTGKACVGLCNSGDCNSGNRNSGDWNSGDWNSGNCNSGDCNSGNRNSGDWNKTSFSNGCFNTEEPEVYMFNKPSGMTYRQWLNSDARYLLKQIPHWRLSWVWSEDMTDEEKKAHPEHETTCGYLKKLDESDNAQIWWNGLNEHDRNVIKALPNFDAVIFEKCTGIKDMQGWRRHHDTSIFK